MVFATEVEIGRSRSEEKIKPLRETRRSCAFCVQCKLHANS
jgi:hypothetical protein